MCRRKMYLVGSLAAVILTVAFYIWIPGDRVQPETYERLVKGMSEEEVDAILSPGALPKTIHRPGRSRKIASELGAVGVGREITHKQLPTFDAEIYDKNTGEFLGKARSWEGCRYSVAASFDADGRLSGKDLYEYERPPVTETELFLSRMIVAIRSLYHAH